MYKSLKYSYGDNLAHFSFGESPHLTPQLLDLSNFDPQLRNRAQWTPELSKPDQIIP